MSNFSRIIIFTISPINEDFLKRYGVDFLKKNEVEVVFLNLCAFLYGPDKAERCGWDRLGNCKEVMEVGVRDYRSLEQQLRNLFDGSIVYLNITVPARLLFLIWKVGIPYIEGSLWGGIQARDWSPDSKSYFEKIGSKILKLCRAPRRLLSGKLDNFLYKFVRLMHPPFLYLTNSYKEIAESEIDNIVLNHTFDYDRFLVNRGIPKPEYIPNEKYLLLLPNHAWMVADYIICDAQDDCSMTQDRYRYLINRTLNKLESLTRMKILVAGYPNAIQEEDVYDGRKFLLGIDTEQLVKYSSGVITHFSGAINFAILHSKPICLINYKDFDNDPRFTNSINAYSRFLKVPINYFDSIDDYSNSGFDELFLINAEIYDDFRHRFITPNELDDKSELFFWERVLKNINGA